MPIVGGRSIRTCLECGSPYCGDGTGAPGSSCKANYQKVKSRDAELSSFLDKNSNSCTCPKPSDFNVTCPKHGLSL